MNIINSPGNIETYARSGMGSSNIDVTMSTQGMTSGVTGWPVSDVTDSLLSYAVDLPSPIIRQEGRRFNVRRADWNLFSRELEIRILSIAATASINEHASTLTSAIIAAVGGRRWAIHRQPWWSDRLTSMRKQLNLSRRLGLRHNDRPAFSHLRNAYLHEIRKSKMESWRNMSNDINSNTWGKAFKYAKNGPRRKKVISSLIREDGTHTESVAETMNTARQFCPAGP